MVSSQTSVNFQKVAKPEELRTFQAAKFLHSSIERLHKRYNSTAAEQSGLARLLCFFI